MFRFFNIYCLCLGFLNIVTIAYPPVTVNGIILGKKVQINIDVNLDESNQPCLKYRRCIFYMSWPAVYFWREGVKKILQKPGQFRISGTFRYIFEIQIHKIHIHFLKCTYLTFLITKIFWKKNNYKILIFYYYF